MHVHACKHTGLQTCVIPLQVFLYSGLECDPAACCCLVCVKLSCRDCNGVSGKPDISATFASARPGRENAGWHMLKSSIKLWGERASHMVRIKLEVLDFFVRLPALWRTWMTRTSSSLIPTRKMETRRRKKERKMLPPPESGQKRSDRECESRFSKPNICVGSPKFKQFGQICTTFFVRLLQKRPKSRFTRTLNLHPELNRTANFWWKEVEKKTVHAAANCLGKAIGWQQSRTLQTQTNCVAWGAGVQPHVYRYWLCRVSP